MSAFPAAFVQATEDALIEGFEGYDPFPTFVQRPVRYTDPHLTISVYPEVWNPIDTFEMTSYAPEPVLARYSLTAQVLVKATEIEGRALIGDYTKFVRAILYRSPSYQVALAALSETLFGSTERYQKRGIASQRFLTNEVRGAFLYVSNTSLWFEVEQVPE